jgi:hypothetical protein
MVGYGRGSIIQLFEGVNGGKNGYNTYDIKGHPYIFSCDYRCYVISRLAIGLSVAYESESGNWQTISGFYYPVVKMGTFSRQVFSVAPEVLVVYERKRNKLLYGYVGVGYSYMRQTNVYSEEYYSSKNYSGVNSLGPYRALPYNNGGYTFQVCAFGFSIGHKVRAYGELGFGYKGIANIGLMAKM